MSEAEAKAAPNNRKFYLLVAAVLLAAVLAGVLSALRSGPTELERLKAELRAKGEKLTLAELFPSPARSKQPPIRTNELASLAKALSAQNKHIEELELVHHLGGGSAEPVWARSNLMTSASRSSPGTIVEWSALESDLAAMESQLTEALALANSPDAHAGLDYRFGAPYSEHSRHKRVIARWFAAAHALQLKRRNFVEAKIYLDGVIHFVGWHFEEMKFGDLMSRAAIAQTGMQLTWSALQEPSVPTGHLAELLTRWQELVLATNFPRVLEVQRASNYSAYSLARERGVSTVMGESLKALDVLGGLVIDADEEFFLRHSQEVLVLGRKAVGDRSFASVRPELARKDAEIDGVYADWRGLRFLLARTLLVGADERWHRRVFQNETSRVLTIAALAVELHRRKHGRHPDSLARLVPEFLPAVPMDWMDGQPLRYRLNADGSFTLWSVGDDFKDDGGDASGPPVNARRNSIWEGRDAVWPTVLRATNAPSNPPPVQP